MIICPNFNNPDVAREFEELKNATSEKAAYAIWSLNNGNAIDKAPNGAESKLFKDLLNAFNGDRKAAIRAKSKVYSNEFINWFGDWINDSENASKVVDENSEPLAVYHFSDNNFSIFDKDKIGTNAGILYGPGFYFSKYINYKDKFPNTFFGDTKYLVFLNIRKPLESTSLKLFEIRRDFGLEGLKVLDKYNEYDGIFALNNKKEYDEFVAWNPNQIKSATGNNGNFYTDNDDINNIVIGERGVKTLDDSQTVINNLSIAKDMEKARKDSLTIKIATGWERGADGKWRYEIPDVTLKKDNFGEDEIRSIVGSDKNHYVTRDLSEVVDLSNLPTIYREELEYVGEILVYDDFTEAEKGSYETKDGKVIFTLNLGADESPKSILAHEFQHYIQDREGFEPGGNTYISRDAYLKQKGLYEVYNKLQNAQGSYNKLLSKILSEDSEYKKYENISRKLDRVFDMVSFEEASEEEIDNFIKQQVPEWEKGVKYDELAEQRKQELINKHKEELEKAKEVDKETYEKLSALDKTIPDSYTAYRRLVGEVEARTAGNRVSMSSQQKRNSLFIEDLYKDVAEEDLIFIKNLNIKTINNAFSIQNGSQFENASLNEFGIETAAILTSGENISSSILIESFLNNGSISSDNISLAKILQRHDIPIKLDGSIGSFTLASTVTDKVTGNSIILLNPLLINQVTKGYLSEAILHEVIHAVTVNAINNPSTAIEQKFQRLNKKVFDKLSKLIPAGSAILNDVDLGLYALKNEKEFAAVFITDEVARNAFFNIATQADNKNKILNLFKNFINSIVQLFVNKKLFNTNEELLKEYQENFVKYLFGIPTQKQDKISKTKIKELYDNIDSHSIETQSLIDKMNFLQNYCDAVERNNIVVPFGRSVNSQEDKTHTFDDIVQKLQIRQNALRTSSLKQSEKNKYINDTKTQIDMFTNQQTAKYIAITSTLRQIIPYVLKDIRQLKNINIDPQSSLSGTEYMYQMHSNIGMYSDIAKTMLGLLNQESSKNQIINEYNSNMPENQKITTQDINEIIKSVQDLAAITQEGLAILEILRDRTAKDILMKKAEKEGNLEGMEEYLNTITENPTFDDNISSFELWLGSMDNASNDALRALSSIVNRALKRADNMVIDKATELLKLQSELKYGESVLDLYEVDDKGFTTGYIVRRLNYGKFHKNYENELIRINKLFNSTFKNVTGYKLLEEDNRVAPQDSVGKIKLTDQQKRQLGLNDTDEYTIQRAWNELKNKWLNENCERKYNKKYYDAWNKVPQVAKDALDSINSEISSILSQPGILGEDGYYHYENLSEEDWNVLQDLWIQKKLLRSDYDIFGNLKQEGSSEYEIAKSLQQLNKDLYGDQHKKIKKDYDSWKKALDKEIRKCGGVSAYNAWKSKQENHGFDVKRFRKWHLRNSRLEFKKDEQGNAIIFQDIENAMQGLIVDYGPEYNSLKDKANELLKPYRAQNGEIYAQQLPEAIKNLLLDIYSKQYEIRKNVLSNNQGLKSISKKYKQIFDQFIKFEDTEYYKQIKREIRKASLKEDGTIDDDLEQALLSYYGNSIIDDSSGMEIGFNPHRWLQRMEAIDIDTYMEYQPGDAWTEKVDDESLLNPNFDESENTAFVPKKSKYDNSKQFSKIEKSPTLKALYNGILSTMDESNKMQSNRQYADNFLLPQVTGTIWKRMKRHSMWGKLEVLFKYIAESFGINNTSNRIASIGAGALFGGIIGVGAGALLGPVVLSSIAGSIVGGIIGNRTKLGSINQEDYSQIGSNMALDEYNVEGVTKINQTPLQGQYPDGRTFHILPQYYTRKMEDPSQISSDLINIVTNYYRMSAYYAERVKIKDDCETIVDFLEQRQTKSTKTRFKKGKNRDKSRLFNAAQKFLEMNLYDMRRSSNTINIGPVELQWSKTVSLWKTWTTRRNLGMNPKVALTGFLTALGTHLINIVTGQDYGHEGVVAFGEVIRRLFQNLGGTRYIANPLSNDDMMLMTEHYDIANQAQKKWLHTNQNRLVRAAYDNSIFGFLSTTDFIMKSIIMVSILMNHHYVNGTFVSREDIRNSRHLYQSKEEFKKALNEWRKGPSLYSLLKGKNEKLTIDEKYKQAFLQTDDIIKERVQTTCEYADGMATDLQRAVISQTIVGALVLIHKQYLPLIIQRHFGKRVYNYDSHQMKNGIFRTLFDFIGQLMQNNLLAGIAAGAFTGSAFGGVMGGIFGGTAALGVRAYGKYKQKRGKESKSLKKIFKDEFSDFSDKKSTMNSYANRYAMRNVLATVVGYRMIVQPLVALICSIADDDDDNIWWLQILAYVMRAFEWEYYTAYRTDDMLNNVKSPTAATSIIDAVEALGYDVAQSPQKIINSIAPQGNLLFDPSQTWDDYENIIGGEDRIIEKGAYEGWTPWQRDIIKATAAHNLIEQLKNAKAKRVYQENQIMHLHKKDD